MNIRDRMYNSFYSIDRRLGTVLTANDAEHTMTNEYIFSPDPYELESMPPPKVVGWFKVYAGFMVFIYLACIAVAPVFLLVDPAELDMGELESRILGIVLLVFGLGLGGAFGLPLIAKPRAWVWTYSIVLICIGMTSACFWPICIPLLIFWVKPETKRYFAKK